MVTLDDVERELTADDLLICDGHDTPIGVAGVMGGASSEIDERTTAVALEMAWFDPVDGRRDGRRASAALGGVGPLRARRRPRWSPTAPSPASSSCCGRRAPTRSCPARSTRAASLPVAAPVRVRPSGSTRCSASTLTTTTSRALLDPIGFAVEPAGRRHRDASRSRRGAPTARRDRRRRGGRAPLRLRAHRHRRCRRRRTRAR